MPAEEGGAAVLVGEVSGAGLAGQGRRRGRCRALELLAHGKESRAAGAGVGGSGGGHGWQQFGDGELGSGTAGGSELGRGLIGPCAPEAAGVAWAQQGRKPAGGGR